MKSIDTDHADFFFIFRKPTFLPRIFECPVFQIIGLQVQDELKQTPPLCLAREQMVVDPVVWSQSAHNADK